MTYDRKGADLQVIVPGFSLADTLNCGQCFRWEPCGKGFRGIHRGRITTVYQDGDQICFRDTDAEIFQTIWAPYFDLDADYGSMQQPFQTDSTLRAACETAGGIHILRQDPWEALCSFIISQNNNIPRIRGIISRLCQYFGDLLEDGVYTFPEPGRLASLTLEDLAPLRAGFRAKYILDAAQKVVSGEVSLTAVSVLSLEDARKELQKIRGVGPKVAECALLYGFHRLDAFPIDTWIKKVLARYYPEGFPAVPNAGLAQQFLFHYVRLLDGAVTSKATG